MLRTNLLLLALTTLGTLSTRAQDALTTLAGSGKQQWTVIGSSSVADASCKAGDASYTFQATPAQVMVKQCVGGAWKSGTEAVTNWSANGKSGIAFGGSKYEVKSLPGTAPACKGNANCVRLVTVPDGKTDATRTIYLAH